MKPLSQEEEQMLTNWFTPGKVLNLENAEKALKEVKTILDGLNVTFFLISGTLLGAIRDKGLMPWDDDIDLGSILGMHGIIESELEKIGATFQDNGFIAKLDSYGGNPFIQTVKYSTLVSWTCFKVQSNHIVQFPALNTPVDYFENLREITFLNDQFLVPNPPEELLKLKYGDEWNIQKQTGTFEGDVLRNSLLNPPPNIVSKMRHLIAKLLPWEETCKIHIVDKNEKPINGAEVTAIGLGNMRSNAKGSVEFYVPQEDFYPIFIQYADQEIIDYLQTLSPGKELLYKFTQEM